MRVGLVCDVLDGQPSGMRIALEGFLGGVARLSRQDTYELIRCGVLDGEWGGRGFAETVIRRGGGFGSGLYWSQIKVPRAIKQMDVDLLHWPCQLLPPVRTAVPLVLSVWDLAPLRYREPGWNAASVIGKYGIILRMALRNSSHVITHSRAIADEVIRRFGTPREKVSTIYPGLDSVFEKEAMRPPHPNPDGHILYVGRNTPRKNLRLLLQAFAVLVKQGIKNDLGLRGTLNGAERSAVERAAREMGIPLSRIEFIPPTGRDGLLQIYRDAALFAFPSLYEGFGLPMIEAMACGLPVVALNRSAMPEVLGDAGILVDDDSPQGFAAGMAEAIRLGERNSDELASRAKARAAEFRWTDAVNRTLSVYEKVGGR